MPKTVQERFFNDPEWKQVEELILGFINPLLNMDTIDIKQPAEHVKAEIVGRRLAYKSLFDFLQQAKFISTKPKVESNPFR